MKTISVQLSDIEYDTFGLSKNLFLFSEFSDLIERQKAKQVLYNYIAITDQNKLSDISMDEISDMVEAFKDVRLFEQGKKNLKSAKELLNEL
jgi:hypothetical protein